MDNQDLLLLLVSVIGCVALIGFFATKAKGFGKYNTATLIVLVALIISSFMVIAGTITNELFGNALMAIIGFAGGLVVANDSSNRSKKD